MPEVTVNLTIKNRITSLGKLNKRDIILIIVLIFVEKVERRYCQRCDFEIESDLFCAPEVTINFATEDVILTKFGTSLEEVGKR